MSTSGTLNFRLTELSAVKAPHTPGVIIYQISPGMVRSEHLVRALYPFVADEAMSRGDVYLFNLLLGVAGVTQVVFKPESSQIEVFFASPFELAYVRTAIQDAVVQGRIPKYTLGYKVYWRQVGDLELELETNFVLGQSTNLRGFQSEDGYFVIPHDVFSYPSEFRLMWAIASNIERSAREFIMLEPYGLTVRRKVGHRWTLDSCLSLILAILELKKLDREAEIIQIGG